MEINPSKELLEALEHVAEFHWLPQLAKALEKSRTASIDQAIDELMLNITSMMAKE